MRGLLFGLLALLVVAPGAFGAEALTEVKELMRGGQHAQALARLEDRLADDPDHAEARFLKGLALVELDRGDEALDVFRGLTTDYPALPEPHNNLAVLYAARGDYDEARESLLTAIEMQPGYAIAHENLGDIYVRMAGRAYGKAVQIDVENDVAREKLEMIRELFSAPDAVAHASEPAPGVEDGGAPAGGGPQAAPVQTAAARPAGPGEAPSATEREVRDTLERWASAWSSQDLDAYLAHYAPEFDPGGGMSRARWERERRSRFAEPEFIEVSLSDVDVTLPAPGEANVTFTQHFRSDTYSDRVRKTMRMSWNGSQWKILSEQSRP